MTKELEAFSEADFSWCKPLESIWSDAATIDGGPNSEIEDSIVSTFFRQTKDPSRRPPSRVLVGQAGIGKTYIVGNLRRKVRAAGGWFVLLDVIGITDFWKSAALSFLTSLLQRTSGERRQSDAILAGVARRLNVESQVEAAFRFPAIDARRIVDLLVPGLDMIDFDKSQKHQDVFRALALLRSQDAASVSVAHAWLQGFEADEEKRKSLGLTRQPPDPIDLVRGMSWVMSLAGPTLIAVDQIDGVIGAGSVTIQGDGFGQKTFAELLSAGLLQLYDVASRSQTVITCLKDTWNELESGLRSAVDRFQIPPSALRSFTDTNHIKAIIESRLTTPYSDFLFTPEYSTWPFTTAAVNSGAGMMPRAILRACDTHRRRCVAEGKVTPCHSLIDDAPAPPEPPTDDGYATDYSRGRMDGSVAMFLDERDDSEMAGLLRDTFDLFVSQCDLPRSVDVVSQSDPTQRMPPLHVRLTFVLHEERDRELHYCFRAIEHSRAVSYSARLRAAVTAAGITSGLKDRHLIIVRRSPVPSGPRTRQLHDAFLAAGGSLIAPTEEDLRSFLALRSLRDAAILGNKLAAFEAWLRAAKPLCDTEFFKSARLCPPPLVALGREASPPSPQPTPPNPAPLTTIPIGHRAGVGGEAVELPTSVLPRHTAIIAGAGSGKTVLLRRIVEEAALAGIPAIVIDPNNDLSRLGDPRPERPEAFTDEDVAKAARYAATVKVVIWTPGVHAGNPLFLSVLPDFAAVGDDPDERGQAVTMAAETLGPLAGAKANLAKGVLADALRHFARTGGTLRDIIALLADLPDGVSEIGNAEKIAAKMADELKAAVATNPLLRATGPVLDPKILFYGPDPMRTRVSVINLSGLTSNEAKEDFVNRLQMTLFGWVKKNPSPRGLLYVIDEAQTFIPSGAGALSKTSGVQLVAQARKYGLGMIAVTQAPKGIDNKVVSNCTTQFLGKQNSPTDQATVKEMIAGTGGRADDVGKLTVGEFYFKTENSGKPVKLRTPICLSWHPPNPPTPDEVVARAKRSRGVE